MGFNQMPQQKQMSQPSGKTRNPYLRSNQQAPTDSGPAPSPGGQPQVQGMGTKGMGQAPPPSDPRAVQRSVSDATLQGPPQNSQTPQGIPQSYQAPQGMPPAGTGGGAAAIASQNWPTNPNGNDYNRKLTEPEYQARWDDLLSRGPVQTVGGRSDLPTWSEYLAQSGEFNGGVTLPDPRSADSPHRGGRMMAYPMADPGTTPRLPGKEMAKWKGGQYTGDGTWENEGTGGTPSGGGPGGKNASVANLVPRRR